MLTDGQFAALLGVVAAGFTGLVTAVRWGAGRVTRSIDRNTDVMLGNTESNAGLSAKLDVISQFVGMRDREQRPMRPHRRAPSSPVVDEDPEA